MAGKITIFTMDWGEEQGAAIPAPDRLNSDARSAQARAKIAQLGEHYCLAKRVTRLDSKARNEHVHEVMRNILNGWCK
jgi:hypothetical protein